MNATEWVCVCVCLCEPKPGTLLLWQPFDPKKRVSYGFDYLSFAQNDIVRAFNL